MAEQTLDLRGLRCPLPALKARKVLGKLVPGDALVLECTDPLTAIDIPNLVRETGDVLESNSESPGLLVFRIRKAGAAGRSIVSYTFPSRQRGKAVGDDRSAGGAGLADTEYQKPGA